VIDSTTDRIADAANAVTLKDYSAFIARSTPADRRFGIAGRVRGGVDAPDRGGSSY